MAVPVITAGTQDFSRFNLVLLIGLIIVSDTIDTCLL